MIYYLYYNKGKLCNLTIRKMKCNGESTYIMEK